jgi:hypothetical protein
VTAVITLAVMVARRTTPATGPEPGHDDTDADTDSPS